MNSITETRTTRRKARTRGSILDAAEGLFLDRGFSAVTIEELSDRADVAVGSIYAHFGSKSGVYEALIERALELDRRYTDEGAAAGERPLERLVGMGEGYLRFAREHPGYFRLFRFPPADRPGEDIAPRPAALVAERIGEETARMADLLREAIEEGVVRELEPVAAARFLWAAWDGVIASHLGPANMSLSEADFERLLNHAREALIRGLLRASP